MPLLLDRGVREMPARFRLPVGLVLAAELLTWPVVARGTPTMPGWQRARDCATQVSVQYDATTDIVSTL